MHYRIDRSRRPTLPGNGETWHHPSQQEGRTCRLREMTMMILHHGWRSSASRRVRLCLEEKGLQYEGHVVDMTAMEHHSPEYLKINPLGVIPTLIHDGQPLHESGTICEYLDETFPDPPLRPDTPYARAEMRNWIRHIDGLIGNLIIFNWRHHLAKTASHGPM